MKKHPTEDGGGGGQVFRSGMGYDSSVFLDLKCEERRTERICERFLVNFFPLQLPPSPLYTKSRPSPSLRANSIPIKHPPWTSIILSPAFQARQPTSPPPPPPVGFQALSPSSLSSSLPWLKAMNARISFVVGFNPLSSSCLHLLLPLSNSVPLMYYNPFPIISLCSAL